MTLSRKIALSSRPRDEGESSPEHIRTEELEVQCFGFLVGAQLSRMQRDTDTKLFILE